MESINGEAGKREEEGSLSKVTLLLTELYVLSFFLFEILAHLNCRPATTFPCMAKTAACPNSGSW
jgi:hypothetical protein